MSTERTYVVDRIEGELIVLIDESSGDKENMGSWELPVIDEGDVLVVQLESDKPKWGTAKVLDEETKRRRAEASRDIEDLEKRDPGGEVAL